MEKITKYNFTNEHAEVLNALRMLFNDLFSIYSKKGAEIEKRVINYELTSTKEMNFLLDSQREFDAWLKKENKFQVEYEVLCHLIDLESKYTKQEFINNLLDTEQYELLNTMKKANHLKSF